MTFAHGDPRWTNTEWRTHLEQAHNSARDKWGAYLSDLALAYWDAYKNVNSTLQGIEALRKFKEQQAQLFWSVILPAVAGGFLGGIVSLRLKAVLSESGIKFVEHSLLIDTGKTVTSDLAKYGTRQIEAAYQGAVDANPWKPSSVDPAQFAEILRNELLHSMVKIDDGLVASEKSSSQSYRNQMIVLYNSPFIWNAPEEQDLAKWRRELWRPLEVFIWADWANHRDAQYWLKRIMGVTDGSVDSDYDEELWEFNPILDRFRECRVPLQYITQTVPRYRHTVGDTVQTQAAHPILNILWVRYLASHYQNTFLGELLKRIQPGGVAQRTWSVNLSLRPGRRRDDCRAVSRHGPAIALQSRNGANYPDAPKVARCTLKRTALRLPLLIRIHPSVRSDLALFGELDHANGGTSSAACGMIGISSGL